ncbi:20543_t:CDS:2, partial [Dentiscutata erythropus]
KLEIISYTEERQEIKNSLLYKELNKSKKKQDLENLERYQIILGLLALAEQRPEDYTWKKEILEL